MKRQNWYITAGLLLVLLSVLLYALHYSIFRDTHHIYIYMLGDIAFLPLEVLFVSLIVDHLLRQRDRRMTMEKMNMVIGAFFSEVGTELLQRFCGFDRKCAEKKDALVVTGRWKDSDFRATAENFAGYEFSIAGRGSTLEQLKSQLVGHRDFMVRLLENPLLLEHEAFTDLLWAVFHLTEELTLRDSLSNLPGPDYEHIEGDMGRVYVLLGRQWLEHMMHLQKNYPYLFSLAMRLNPFDPRASVVFQ